MAQRPPTQRVSSPSETISNCTQGVNQYTDPTLTKPQQWFDSNNVFSGLFGYIQRARWANVVGPVNATGITISNIHVSFPSIIVTVTTSTPHGLSIGQQFIVEGVITTAAVNFNGTWTVANVLSGTQFSYEFPTNYANYYASDTQTNGLIFPRYYSQFAPFTSFKYYAIPLGGSYLLADAGNRLFSFDTGNSYVGAQRINNYVDPVGGGNSKLAGPWSRETLNNIIYEMNGQVKQTGRDANALTIEGFGLDAPDVSPQVTVTSGASQNITNIQRTNGTVTVTLAAALTVPGGNGRGMINVTITAGDTTFAGTFVVLTGSGTTTLTWSQTGNNTALLTPTGTVNYSITKSVGRSYAYAWENANKAHVGAPSPITQYIQYNGQYGTIQCIEQGTVTIGASSTTVTGTGTNFTSAWVGRSLWVPVVAGSGVFGLIQSVTNATTMTLAFPSPQAVTGVVFQIFDPQATHIRLYATADGGATYFRIQRNQWGPIGTTVDLAGLQFFDTANSEPPAFPFTTETSQLYNIPPPVGSFLKEYQGSLLTYGVPGAPQSFFYSNTSLTTVGLQQESYAPLNQVTLPIQNASINGMAECPGSLIIWSDKQDMFRLTGLLTDNTSATASQQGATITALPYNLGCATPFAVALTPLGVIWLTSNAEVWLYTDRYAPRNIGRPIITTLQSITPANLSLCRMAYYHVANRDWLLLAVPAAGSNTNNTVLILDLEQLASNGSPSYFVFDMATNQPVWYPYSTTATAIETVYEHAGAVRIITGVFTDVIRDIDFQPNAFNSLFGTEINVIQAFATLHAWGNDSPQIIKRPTWFRFGTNQLPSNLAAQGWGFGAAGIDDDFYTFTNPLTLNMTPGVNDASTLGGNQNLLSGSPFRHSPELFKVGGVNFTMGRRFQFTITFPITTGTNFQWRQIQIGFGPSPPR